MSVLFAGFVEKYSIVKRKIWWWIFFGEAFNDVLNIGVIFLVSFNVLKGFGNFEKKVYRFWVWFDIGRR